MHASTIRRAANWSLANGAKIPKLGLGTWKMTKEQAVPAVSHAIKTGYRHLDCAWAYRNEDAVGEGIRKSGINRNELWITSKLWNSFHEPENVEKCLDATLKDLGTDYLDLWLMHWPVAFLNSTGAQVSSIRSQQGYPIEQPELSENFMATYEVMEEMVKKGKVRNLGVSNFNIRRIDEITEKAKIKPLVNQVEVNWGVPNDELLHFSHAHDVKLQAYSPFGGSGNAEAHLSEPIVLDVAKRNNMTPAQALLAWQLGRGIITIAKSVSPARLEENFKVMELELPEGDVKHLTYEAMSKPLDRSVDPTQGWNVRDDIFEDGVDQTRDMKLKNDSYVPPPAHESPVEHRLEPRNAQFHTMTSPLASTRRSTILQQLGRRAPFRSFGSSSRNGAVAEAASTSSQAPVVGSSPLLRETSKAAVKTPGLTFTDGEQGIERETKKMNMYTVRTPKESELRKYTTRKSFLFEQYTRLLEESQLVIVLQHNNLTVSELAKVRNDIAALKLPEDAKVEGISSSNARAKLTVVRPGLMKPIVRGSKAEAVAALEPLFSGPIALLTCPTLSPSYVSSLLGVIDRALGHAPGPSTPAGQPHPVTATANPRVVPLAAVLEGNKVLEIPAVRDVGRLGSLATLRAQIVGLLSQPGQQIAGILQQASGSSLAMTLEARKRQLEESKEE
ncbi:hypothetical protein IE53DRAFT_240458 [Violaceomyces palustris]|uniref:Uncharacterized protein n=1 Tax=Violaceomyces palustris TaxID=1673888 RepID=A0ACD0P451_9BASI|nr:hypothetical protein IE53DRAFT_240458 [Violaceomyces palustris]